MRRDEVRSTRVRSGGGGHPLRTWARRVVQAGVGGLVLGVGVAAPASAHVIVTPTTTAAGAHAVLEFSVGHGCKGSPTTRISIQMPAEIMSVSPTRSALWKVEKAMEKLDPPRTDAHGNEIAQRVASVTFSTATALPEGQREVFQLAVQLPETEGTKLVFPTIQTCQRGESAWIEVPQEGQEIAELDLPAPGFVVSKAGADDHRGASSTAATAGDSHDAESPARAQETNSGRLLPFAALAAGVIGCVLGGAALVRQRRQT
ncbi:conserved hypothetical protein [Kribbella flavida DSM 17836]|uniref:YncI copper-binding domain-containing protein n=1 Tax=Kribbella flavida (strain DSM 17836 / JCM 10339 / NBRC 14399) TaxID=479435 RepID=D2PTT5_KRIFD|nr:YcnI family protein [Kribbella flavida]ADB33218.1 conserved hypothetical protein [Kribbella flavida DSM 17836]